MDDPQESEGLEVLKTRAPEAAEFLRRLANPNRLLLLCHLSQGERSVAEIERELGIRQPYLSQQLAELRRADLVKTRRQSRSVYYSLSDARVAPVVTLLYDLFCRPRG